MWLYEQRGSIVSAASGRGPYYNFPKLHCSNSSEAVHVQQHNKIVTRDKVSDLLNCTDAWSNLFRNHLNIIIPIQVLVNFFPNHWDDWYQAIIGHIWTFSFILVEWSNSWAQQWFRNQIRTLSQKLARNIVKTCCFRFTKFRCIVLFTGRGSF